MSDLLAPLLVVLEDEVMAYWCFNSLIKRMVIVILFWCYTLSGGGGKVVFTPLSGLVLR